MDIFNLINKSKSAISHSDSSEAYWLLRDWKNLLASTDADKMPYSAKDIDLLLLRLRVTAFSHLPDNESAEMLKEHLLDFFNIEASLEPLLIEKLFLVPYGARRDLRELLKKAILSNNELLGRLTIGQWLEDFDKKYDPKTRTRNAALDFVNNHLETQKMDLMSKDRLKKILHAYDYLLVYTLPETEPELGQMIERGFSPEEIESQGIPASIYNYSGEANAEQNENLHFNEALKKYPEMGEQIITSYKINLKMFPEPVRPSIKNWISDYTFNVGYNNQDSLARSNYLFQNQNTKNLSSADRNRLSFILKTYDENSTISANPKTMQIAIPESTAAPRAASVRPEAPAPLLNRSSMEFRTNNSSLPRPVYELNRSMPQTKPATGQNNFNNSTRQELSNLSRPIANETKKSEPIHRYPNDHQMSITHPDIQQNFQTPARTNSPRQIVTAPVIPKEDLISFSQRPSAAPATAAPIVTAPAPARTQIQTPPITRTKNINFSSPQKMSYEKIEKVSQEQPQMQPRQLQPQIQPQPRKTSPETHPYRISYGPQSAREENAPQQKQPLPKNVVNLREQ